ncbi:MAG: beta-ketoacyl-[acyl-carrier-protein] synthase family protein [Acidobacteriota bacterium]
MTLPNGTAREPIVVTGVGAVTPVGNDAESTWSALLAGRCGIDRVRSFDPTPYRSDRGAEVKDFDPAPYFTRLDPRDVGRASQLAVAAARMALDDAGGVGAVRPGEASRAGVVMGTTSGEPLEVERFNDAMLDERLDRSGQRIVTRYPSHAISATIAAEMGFAGGNTMIPAACAAGNYAIAHAFDQLRIGRAEVMLAGGADAFSRITYAGFARLGAIATTLCRPFDQTREGMVPGEGAAVVVLETLSRARARGAHIYAEIAGCGLSCDAHHMTAAHPEGRGAAEAMTMALTQAAVRPEDVSYVSAHGTGTPTNDRLETIALHRVFGSDVVRRTPVSSIKSMIGHTMGAASAIEAVICALAVTRDRVPPTIHFETPDPDCALDCVPNQARALPVQVAMSNAYAFGGNNASVLFRTVEM